MDINSRIRLNNGVEMPMLGLGTWLLSSESAEKSVRAALKAGYRHIDTAAYYGNEESVGKAIRESGVPREQIFVTTKLKNDGHSNPVAAFETSFEKLNIGYIDLYLIHWPVEGMRNDTWKMLEGLVGDRCRAIGVSNFTIKHLEELATKSNVVPAVNQVEFNPFLYQKELLDYCRKKGIQLEAYCPLARGKKFGDAKLLAIAKGYNKSPAQILIRWGLQHSIVVIPKSQKKERIDENANVFSFEISDDDMERLDSFNENFRLCWDPSEIP